MKYTYKAFILSFIILFSSNINAYAKSYINGYDKDFPPFTYVDEHGKADGLDIKAIDWIAKEMGIEIIHVPLPWNGIIPVLIKGDIDIISSAMTITEEREKLVRFTDPYMEYSQVLLAKDGSSLSMNKAFSSRIKIGVQRGTDEHIFLEKMKIDKNLHYKLYFYSSIPLATSALVNGQIDVAAMNMFSAHDAISKKLPVKILGTFADVQNFAIAVRKNKEDDALYELLNEGYKKLLKDPYWDELKFIYLDKNIN